MEQTVNQFTKGLQTDTHPMVQGNDTLSDALNATFVTMNGNEVVLQNDMGNRRIDNAFLPVGYEPVGIKEYGGIIYVAAYNPITNKSQIGSFPSPERKINHLDNPNLKGELNLSDLNDSYNKNGINYLTRDSLLIPLTKDTSLHAGDKFVVYGSVDSSNITNYNNSYSNKAKTPKNKLYTLALGVLNSQNEFVDITKTLVRWGNDNKIIKFGEDATDIYKFNTGYFIASSLPDDLSNMTQDDQQLLQERLKCSANTYSYKLVGPLYLKATLNHISGFNYNIYGVKNGDTGNAYTIWIEADIIYNCPDGINISDTDNNGNEYYKSFEEGVSDFEFFTLYSNSGITTIDNTFPKPTTKYDPITNLYSAKVVKKYKIESTNNDYNYTIAVYSGISNVYLKELSNSGTINLSKLGSNTVELTEWRFSNNYEKQETTLTYSFNAYPEYGKTFDNLQFKFTPYENNNGTWNFNSTNAKTIPGQLYNGRVTTQLSWNAVGLEPRTFYKVEYSYNEVENGNPTPKTPTETRWFLTTELFNECYNLSLDTGVKDFGNSNDDSYSNIEALLKVAYALDANAVGLVIDTRSGITQDSTSLLTTGSNIKYINETQKDLEISLDYSVLINEDLYPNYIIPKSNSDVASKITVSNVKLETQKIEQEIISGSGRPEDISEDDCTPKLLTENSTTTNTFIKRTISTKDIFSSNTASDNNQKYIENGFIGFINDYIANYKSDRKITPQMKYATVFLDFDEHYGSDDEHYYLFGRSDNENGLNINRENGMDYTWLHSGDQEDIYDKWYTDGIGSQIQDCLNALPREVVFTWLMGGGGSNKMWFSSTRGKTDGEYNSEGSSRLWWRTSQNTWALFPELIHNPGQSTNFKNFIEVAFKLLGNVSDYKFAYYKRVALNDLHLKSPGNNQSRTKHYEQEATIKWDTTVTSGDSKDLFDNFSSNQSNNAILKFTIDNLNDNIKNSYTTTISTPESFEDTIAKKDESVFSNVDIATLKFVDYKGEELDANKIYRVDINNGVQSDLVPFDTYDIVISDNFGGNDRRAIVYNKDIPGTPSQRYDNRGADQDSMTVLDYSGANVVVL